MPCHIYHPPINLGVFYPFRGYFENNPAQDSLYSDSTFSLPLHGSGIFGIIPDRGLRAGQRDILGEKHVVLNIGFGKLRSGHCYILFFMGRVFSLKTYNPLGKFLLTH